MGEEAGEAGGIAGLEIAAGFDAGEEAESVSHDGGEGWDPISRVRGRVCS